MAKPTILPIWDTDETNSIEPDVDHKLDGWLAPGGLPEKPPFQTFNFWQNAVYKWIKEINQQGILQYDALTDYPVGALVIGTDNETYIAASANGPATAVKDPVGDTTGVWENFYFNTSSNVVTGTADALILNAISGINPSAFFDGQLFTFKAASDNTGAVTIQIGSLATKSLTHGDGSAMNSGEISQNNYSQIAYNKTSDRFELASLGQDIPIGETIIFYKDTAVIGYSLVAPSDDKSVCITKGSAAGGETGGTLHSSGSWTISGLTSNAHTHPGPSHTHTTLLPKSGWSSTTASNAREFWAGSSANRVSNRTLTSDAAGTGNTGTASASGITSAGTWRPAAYCFTMQQRS